MSAYVKFPKVKKVYFKTEILNCSPVYQTNCISWYFKECSNGIIMLCFTYYELSFASLINFNGRTRTTVGYDFCVHVCRHIYMYFIDARVHDLLRMIPVQTIQFATSWKYYRCFYQVFISFVLINWRNYFKMGLTTDIFSFKFGHVYLLGISLF